MIVVYEREQENILNELEDVLQDKCLYYASDIMQFFELSKQEFHEALIKAEHALESLHIPLRYHFKTIFRVSDEGILTDIKLSSIASYFLTIHIDPVNPIAAKMQWYFAAGQGM